MEDRRDTGDARAARELESPPPVPRWVKVAAILGVVIVLLVVVILIVGGGDHGPGRHLGGDAAPSGQEQSQPGRSGHRPPAGAH